MRESDRALIWNCRLTAYYLHIKNSVLLKTKNLTRYRSKSNFV